MKKCAAFATVIALAVPAWSASIAHAGVSVVFAEGSTCSGAPAAKWKPGSEFKVTLCMTLTDVSACGHSLQLEAESAAESGAFEVVQHVPGKNYPDLTMEKISRPIAITFPPTSNDYGATRDDAAPPSAGQPIMTFTLRPTANAKNAAYEIHLGKNSLVSLSKDSSCLQNFEAPLTARMKLIRQ